MAASIQNQQGVSETSLSIINEGLPNKKPGTKAKAIVSCKLTSTKKAVLKYLVDWRFGTTTQIWEEVQRSKGQRHTRKDLESLRNSGLINSFKVYPERGENSELCWTLTKPGANIIDAKYNNQYAIRPSRERIFLRDMELELARSVNLVGWQLISPTNYSPHRPMPKETPQYHKLVETVDALETVRVRTALLNGQIAQSSQTYINYKERQHLWGLHCQVNDYVAFVEGVPGAVVVFMLCPPNTGRKAWEARLKKYNQYAKHLPVYGVFADEKTRVIGQEILARTAADEKIKRLLSGYGANLKTTTLPQVYDLLDQITSSVVFNS